MPEMFARVALLGLGLMGGSLGLSLRAAGLAREIIGCDGAPGRAEQARLRGAIDRAFNTPAEAVEGADLVVLAVPVLAERELLATIASHIAPDALVTDLGSTKVAVAHWASGALADPSRFVGGHPMTGRERSGIDAADADLYTGATWVLTPTPQTDPSCVERLSALIYALGATVLQLDAERHDWLVGGASHLPLVAAVALMRAVAGSADWPLMSQIAAGGLRDGTRVSSGDPIMSRDIALTNGPAIASWLDSYLAELHALRDSIVAQDTSRIEHFFLSAREAREQWQRRSTS